jgi:hypothetical protein
MSNEQAFVMSDDLHPLYPRCTSLRSDFGRGGRVDYGGLSPGEFSYLAADGDPFTGPRVEDLAVCGFVDLSVLWLDDEEPPTDWHCTECGGTEFEGVHQSAEADD